MEATYHVFIDDYRNPKDCCDYMPNKKYYFDTTFIVVRNYDAFIQLIANKFKSGHLPITITFDHDLAMDHYAPSHVYDDYGGYNAWAKEQNFVEKTGYDCAKWLVDFCIENNMTLPKYYIHSMNPPGANNIRAYLENYKKHVLQQ